MTYKKRKEKEKEHEHVQKNSQTCKKKTHELLGLKIISHWYLLLTSVFKRKRNINVLYKSRVSAPQIMKENMFFFFFLRPVHVHSCYVLKIMHTNAPHTLNLIFLFSYDKYLLYGHVSPSAFRCCYCY
jgi:hypothetical protein